MITMAHKRIIWIILILSLCLNSISCTPMVRYARKTARSYEIRVKLRTVKLPLQISGKKLLITDKISGQPIIDAKKNKQIIIIQNGSSTMINDKRIDSPVEIISEKDEPIYINDRCYFGTIRIIPGLNPLILNIVPIETYLMSVVSSEMPTSFEVNALAAQAIIARTYSYYFMLKNVEEAFDVDDTTAYQVYNGFAQLCGDHSAARKLFRVIASTQSIIACYEDKPIIAYFHANSGGRTKSGLSYFGPKSDFPYLIAHDDPYSVDQPGYSWTYTMQRSDFDKIFSHNCDIVPTDDGQQSIRVGSTTFAPKQVRAKIGYGKVKSETYTIDMSDDNVTFTGFGYGHGVGMSQWGANAMAKQKFSFGQIIEFYYPGIKLERF